MASKRVKKKQAKKQSQSQFEKVQKKIAIQQKLINSLDTSKFTPAQARRFASMKKEVKHLKDEFKVIRESELAAAKERYATSHRNVQTIKDRLSNQEINQAIRFLHDKGIVRSSNEYYEDFLEINEDKWTIEEVREMLGEYEESERQALEATLNLITDGYYNQIPYVRNTEEIFG